MADQFTIGNLALQILGQSTRITDFTSTAPGRAIGNCYDNVRQAELRAHTWKFAITRAQLISDLTNPAFGPARRFALPTGHLRILPRDQQDATFQRDWVVEGQYITSSQIDRVISLTDVRVATTANGTLATAYENGDTVDGVVLATGDRILLKDQTSGAENGIYTVNASGAPTRATDFDSDTEALFGTYVKVTAGTTNAGRYYMLATNDFITLGTTAQTWTRVNSAPGSLFLRQVIDITTVDNMDPCFQKAFAAQLAYTTCEEITQSNSKQQLAQARYVDAIAEARKTNAIEKPPIKSFTDPWITAREFGGPDPFGPRSTGW